MTIPFSLNRGARGRRSYAGFLAVAFALLVAGTASAQTEEAAASPIEYSTRFQHPVSSPTATALQDTAIENYIIEHINASPPGAEIGLAVRDWTRTQVATALLNAHARGVQITGVIDGSERVRPFLQDLVNTLGGGVIFCGSPTFQFHSCISNVRTPGLMHNKFWTFSELSDGSKHVVLQTSLNFTGPQLRDFQDLIRIKGDVGLYNGYREYLADMKAQVRSNNYYKEWTGDDGRNTMWGFPRFQPDDWTDDATVDRLNELDCSDGGVIRAAQAGFRSERLVIAERLVELKEEGCEVGVVNTNGDPEVVALLLNRGVAYYPLMNAVTNLATHTKLWVADAGNTVTDERTKVAYMGSVNWRPFVTETEDALLRVFNDQVYADYNAYWEEMRNLSQYFRRGNPAVQVDAVKPATAASASPAPNANGWNKTDVTVRIDGSDGVGEKELEKGGGTHVATGIKDLKVALSGAQTGTADRLGAPAYTVSLTATPVVTEEDTTTVTHYAVDHKNNQGEIGTVEVKIDKTAPTVALVEGPADGGSYYFGSVPEPPTCSPSDALSKIDGSCNVSGYSASVGSHTVTATAMDKAGNVATDSAEYTVLAWTLRGFYRPVDMDNVVNTVKNGATVPLKFEIFSGSDELTDPANVRSLSAKRIGCASLSDEPTDAIEVTATGGTSLRYDTVSGHFIFNWKTPDKADACFRVTMTTNDGSHIDAFFKLK